MKTPREVLITGGAGFIGSHLVDRLLDEGSWSITVFDNFDDFYSPEIKLSNIRRHFDNPLFRLIRADIHDTESLETYFEEFKPSTVIHLAAKTGVRQSLGNSVPYLDTNVRGTLKLLEVIRRHGADLFIYGSSSAVYGSRETLPFHEEDDLRPISPYGMSKAAAELVCHTYSHLYNLRCICLRIFTVYGERQRPDLAIHKFAELIMKGVPIPAYGIGKVRDYAYISDIVTGIRLAMDYRGPRYETINLGGARAVELLAMINILEERLGTKAVIQRLPLQPGDQLHTVADISKARDLLGFAPRVQIEEGLSRFVEWFKISLASNLMDIDSFRHSKKAGSV